jgi:short-subunit dehydrogenase
VSKSRFEGTVVVTGASSGIGLEMARLIAKRAKTLILVARRTAKLETVRAELIAKYTDLKVEVLTCDLSDRTATKRLAGELSARDGGVDVLVNNAGLGDMGLFEKSSEDKTLGMLDVNVTAVLILTRELLPPMVARGRGGVLNISSGFGLGYLPSFASYVGTKHFVTGFTHVLRAELAGTGVNVTQVCPGPVATEFEENVGNFTGQKVPGFIEISAEKCARAAVSGFESGRAVVVPGMVMKLAMLANGATPAFIMRLVARVLGGIARRAQLR